MNLWNTGAILLSLIAGFIHYKYLWTLFENERHFSHLATIERDISFRTEQGLYYSYYKSIINAPSFKSGLNDVLQDTVTEHPSTFNVLKRFNLWPEVVAAASYRLFVKSLAEGFFKKRTKECWMVNRGDGKSQVHSCEGWGDEHYFYVNLVFLLNGFVLVGGIFYLSTSVSKSYLGGIVSVVMYFFNHGECTRCMWTPPLREQWSFPFLPMQIYMVTKILATEKTRLSDTLKLTFFTSVFMVSWQFSQFALFTQTASIVVIYLLDICNSDQVKSVLKAQLFSILLNFIIQFGNEMLLTSFGFSSILVAFVVVEVKSKLQSTNFKVLPIFKVLIGLIPWFAGTYGLKGTITRLFGIQDDAHIFDILVSKFSNFATFHTKLYTCAPEFDFLPIATFQVFVGTGLLFFVVALVTVYAYQTIKYSVGLDVKKIPADELYIVVQSCAYTLVAILIMRLKLFMSPLFCILSCLVVKQGVFSDDEKIVKRWKILFFGILTFGAFGLPSLGFQGGLNNINNELMKVGNFENIPQEDMLEWVIANTVKEGEGKAVFAGPMPIMATMKHVKVVEI